MKTVTAALAALTLATAAPALAVEPSRLTLTFETGAPTGAVMVALYDSEAAWSDGAPVRSARPTALVLVSASTSPPASGPPPSMTCPPAITA